MPAPKSRARRKSAKKGGGRKKSAKFLVLFGVMGLFLLVELVALIINKSGESKMLPVQSLAEFSGDNQACGAFKAWDVLGTADNRIAVSDQPGNRILFFDAQGKYLSAVGNAQAGDPPFKEISCLTQDASGDVYVMDTWNTLIRGFDPKGNALPVADLNNKGFYGPRGVAWDNGAFLIADTGSHRLVRVSPDGSIQAAWGHHGSGKEDFNNPCEVATDGQGHYDVVDQDNDRIQVVGSDGKFLKAIKLGAPAKAVAVDAQRKILYVSSQEGKFIRAYNLEGQLLGNLAQGGPKNPQPLADANALGVLPNGDIVVARGDKVSVYHLTQPL